MPLAIGIACLLLGARFLPAQPLEAQAERESPWRLGAPQTIVASSGLFEPIVGDGKSYEIGAELRFAPRRLPVLPRFVPDLMPTVGVIASAQGALYAYGGLGVDIPLGERWTFSPGTGMGFYFRSYSKDLGGRSSSGPPSSCRTACPTMRGSGSVSTTCRTPACARPTRGASRWCSPTARG